MVDNIPNLKIIATGSASFDLSQQIGEPLVEWLIGLRMQWML